MEKKRRVHPKEDCQQGKARRRMLLAVNKVCGDSQQVAMIKSGIES